VNHRMSGNGCGMTFLKNIDLLLMPIQSKEEFIHQAVVFLSVLKPKRMIPMHYWSSAYKADFLLSARGKGYRVEERPGPVYVLEKSSEASGLTRVIALEPAPYTESRVLL